jgi:hypothetical protein
LRVDLLLPDRSASATMRLDALEPSSQPRKFVATIRFSTALAVSAASDPDRLLKSGDNEIIVPPGQALTFLFRPARQSTQLSSEFFVVSSITEERYEQQRTKFTKLSWLRDRLQLEVSTTGEQASTPTGAPPRRVQVVSHLPYKTSVSETCYRFSDARVCAPDSLDIVEASGPGGLRLKGEDFRWVRLEWNGQFSASGHSMAALNLSSATDGVAIGSMIDSIVIEWRDSANSVRTASLRANGIVSLPAGQETMRDFKIYLYMRLGGFDLSINELRILALRNGDSTGSVDQALALDLDQPLLPKPSTQAASSADAAVWGDRFVFFRNSPGWGKAVSLQWSMPISVRRSELLGLQIFAVWPEALARTNHVFALTIKGAEHAVTVPLRLDPAKSNYSIRSSDLFPADWPLDDTLLTIEAQVDASSKDDYVFGAFVGQIAVSATVRSVGSSANLAGLPLLDVGYRKILIPPLSNDQVRVLLTQGEWIEVGTWSAADARLVRRVQNSVVEVDGIRLDPVDRSPSARRE